MTETRYITRRDVLIAIQPSSGRWCSFDTADLFPLPPAERIWRLEELPIANPDRRELAELVEATLAGQGATDDDGGDHRSFEYLLIKCTSACNYHCTYCYDHDQLDQARNLDLERTCAIVEQSIRSASGRSFTLLFHGGEPLIRKRFVREVTEFARSVAREANVRLFFKLQTHGGMFDDEIVEFLDENEFFVGISIDGPREINDLHRVLKDGSGTYHRFESAYHRYRSFMSRRCGIVTTPTIYSAEHFLAIARHFHAMGFRGWRTTNYLAIGRVRDDWRLETGEETYVASVMALIDAIEEGEFDRFRIDPVFSHLGNLLSPERTNMCKPGNNPCGAGRRFLSIEADGTVLPCDTLSREEFTVGSIPESRLREMLDHPNALKIAHSLPRSSCRQCVLLGVCGGTCLGLSSLTENRPLLCNAYKRIYPELMRRLHLSDRLLDYFTGCMEEEDRLLRLDTEERDGNHHHTTGLA